MLSGAVLGVLTLTVSALAKVAQWAIVTGLDAFDIRRREGWITMRRSGL